MRRETFTDKCGLTISREAAIREATYTILNQGDAVHIVREAVESMPDDEIMLWLAYPDTGEFPDHLHRGRA